MPTSLTKDQRKLLSDITLAARDAAESAARAALENLAVHEGEYRGHMTVDQRQLRNRLRARGRALGDRLEPRTSAQTLDHLAESAAYEHWHRLLFTRFLAENHLLHTDEKHGTVPVTLEECDELAPELGARDGFELACRFASETLPGVFRRDDPVLELRLAPNHEVQLRRLVDRLHPEIFRADDALGWTYQFWQAMAKKRINESGVKIGADELPAVTPALHRGLHGGVPAPQLDRRLVGGQARPGAGGDGAPGLGRPASRLHAGDGDDNVLMGTDQEGEVEDAVLLGTDQLLAVEEQHRDLAVVLEPQFGNTPSFGGLGDPGAARGQSLVEDPIPRLGWSLGEQRIKGEVVDDLGLTQGDLIEKRSCRGHGNLPPGGHRGNHPTLALWERGWLIP